MTLQDTPQQEGSPVDRPDQGNAATVVAVRFEHHREAFGIGSARPRLSWITETPATDWYQAGYEIEAYQPDGSIGDRTGRIASGQSVLVPWPFRPLHPASAACCACGCGVPTGNPRPGASLHPSKRGCCTPAIGRLVS